MSQNSKFYENSPQKAYQFFQTAKNELKTQNRFSNERIDGLLNQVFSDSSFAVTEESGSLLYRGRIYDKDDAEKRFKQTDLQFQGYDAKDSFVNPNSDTISNGRCNPTFIPYLYTAESPECCIHELRPNIGSYVSIATIKVNRPLKILDISQDHFFCDVSSPIISGAYNSTAFLYLTHFFSAPYQSEGDYILPQYISEKVKNAGFDGLSYCSAVFSGRKNTNVVIFNFDECEPIESKLYRVNDIKIVTETG